MLTFNRHCHSSKTLSLLRSHFGLFKCSLPIILHEITTDAEVALSDAQIASSTITAGTYLAFLQYNRKEYQPLIDLKLIPVELFPEKNFLPKTMPFVIGERHLFVKALRNAIEYMQEYQRVQRTYQTYMSATNNQSPRHSITQISTTKNRTKASAVQISCASMSSDAPLTPVSASSILPICLNQNLDIRKYLVTDPERINQTAADTGSSLFTFRILNRQEQHAPSSIMTFPPLVDVSDNILRTFNENDLVLFKGRLSSLNIDPSLSLDLKNCIHQLSIDKGLDVVEVREILIGLNHRIIHNELHNRDIPKLIRDLQRSVLRQAEENILSNLMKTLLRIDHLAKFGKLNQHEVYVFKERIDHLARLGVLHQQPKLFARLFQLNLFEGQPDQESFSNFVHADVQHIIPKKIPLNALGMREILHQLQLNTVRLGPLTTLLLIDNLQQMAETGLFLTLNRTPQLKQYLLQLVDQIQAGRFIGTHLQRVVEHMAASVRMNFGKKLLLTNQLHSLFQKSTPGSKRSSERLFPMLMNFALQGQLSACANIALQDLTVEAISSLTFTHKSIDLTSNHLQSLLLFLHEQSTASSPPGALPSRYVDDFVQHLRHLAQLGILYAPKIACIFTDLHQAKDQDRITMQLFKVLFEQMKTMNYVYAYDHLNLPEFNHWLNDMITEGNLTRGQAWYVLDRLVYLCQMEPVTNYDLKTLLRNIQLEHHRQQPIYPKLMDSFQSMAASYSSSLTELHSLERDLQNILRSSTSNIKRIPDEVRRRLNEMISLCQQFSLNGSLREHLFGPTMNYKFYDKMKSVFKTKNLISRKQSLTAIVQMHKHFLQTSRRNSRSFLSSDQIDTILQNMQNQSFGLEKIVEDCIRRMAELGRLQEEPFVDYCIQYCLTDQWSSSVDEIRNQLSTWPFRLDLNHPSVREVTQHLLQLELEERLDAGTSIEIQNRLNQIARFGRWSSPRMRLINDGILNSHGKSHLTDRSGFQSIQSYRWILNDIAHAIEFDFYIQQLASECRISDDANYRFRQFLYQVLQNEVSIDGLSRYRSHFNDFHHIKQMDIDQVERFDNSLSKEFHPPLPFTITDRLLERLKWDAVVVKTATREQLLQLERDGILSNDLFETIYGELYRGSDLSHLT